MSSAGLQRIAISGATGLVGSQLSLLLKSSGQTVLPISRSSRGGGTEAIVWDPSKGVLNPEAMEAVDAVVHLAGENIAGGRWTPAIKERIRSSRIDGTRSLVQSLSMLQQRPKTFVCASAIGYYGERGDELVNESSSPGEGFLADVCKAWEHEALAAADLGIRVVCVRIGVVLSRKGGALAKMLLPFKLGLGGVVGSGKQYWSWIGLNDLVRSIAFCLQNESVIGSVNAVSPEPMTNRDFTKVLGSVLHRPTIFPMPAFMARLLLGEMADELLLSSTRVTPDRLLTHGFMYEQPQLKSCLEHELA